MVDNLVPKGRNQDGNQKRTFLSFEKNGTSKKVIKREEVAAIERKGQVERMSKLLDNNIIFINENIDNTTLHLSLRAQF